MKITDIVAIPIPIPFTQGGNSTNFIAGEGNELGHLLIKVETDSGITGYGEAFGFNAIHTTKTAVDTLIAPMAIGRNPLQIEALMKELSVKTHILGRYGVTMFALSGLDIALWDIAGKAAGIPLHQMLGGAQRSKIPAYASLLKYGDPDVCARLTDEALTQGYGLIKLHENTVAPVIATRAAAGEDVPITLDVNCSWSPQEANEMAGKLAPCNLHWLEEPIWPPENFEALYELRNLHGIPIATGENACTAWQFSQMFKAGAVDYAQPSVTKVGGITEMKKVSTLAEIENVTLQPHSPYFGPGFLATLHFLAASSGTQSIERFFVTLDADMYEKALDPIDGLIQIPDSPGLGLDPDPAFIEKYRAD